MPETEQLLPSTNGYYDLPKNQDGSIDIWFGPKQPDGVADAAFIQTIPERHFLVALRLYGTGVEFYDQTLKPDDVYIDRVLDINTTVAPQDWARFYSDALSKLEPGVTEVVIHLAYDDAEMHGATVNHPNWGAAWRQRDFEFFTSDAFRKVLHDNQIKLITWRELGKLIK